MLLFHCSVRKLFIFLPQNLILAVELHVKMEEFAPTSENPVQVIRANVLVALRASVVNLVGTGYITVVFSH